MGERFVRSLGLWFSSHVPGLLFRRRVLSGGRVFCCVPELNAEGGH